MINSIVLAGNVVADPESRSTQTGKAIATFRLAVNNPINDKDVVYIDVDTWEKQADFVTTYVKKGSAVSVVGRLKQDSWEKDGKKQSKILVVADRVNFVGGKKKDTAQDGEEQDETAQRPAVKQAAKPAAKAPAYSKPQKPAPLEDDEVPM
ncbi:MAG: single-stranded DNA-binding protein [Candidatus Methylopumilus sp.]|jgi:single-strand DNA-binding protein|nr:single-stranded DNA-binding protein [Candidatus Methylopumilus sp.]